MKATHRIKLGALAVFGSFVLAAAAAAQQKQQLLPQTAVSYDVARETALTGTVVSFSEDSTAGAHLVLHTSSGITDINVGNAKLLSLNGFTFAAGDTVHVVGETVNVAGSSFFAARIVQKGTQSLTVRSQRGFMARPTRNNVPASAWNPRGVL